MDSGEFASYSVGRNTTIQFRNTSAETKRKISIFCGEDCRISVDGISNINTHLSIYMVDHCNLFIGSDTMINGPLATQQHEPSTISIGDHCGFGKCNIWTSDMHSLLDLESGERINPAKDVSIGNHVWIAYEALILKGTSIGSGSMVGARSMVNAKFPDNVVLAGSPARVVRSGITWRLDLI